MLFCADLELCFASRACCRELGCQQQPRSCTTASRKALARAPEHFPEPPGHAVSARNQSTDWVGGLKGRIVPQESHGALCDCGDMALAAERPGHVSGNTVTREPGRLAAVR